MRTLAVVRSLTSLASAINTAHDAHTRALHSAVEHARRAGALLIEAKAQLGHGEFLPWVDANCPDISRRTAQNYMTLAKANAQHVAHLTVREALALLSTPREREPGGSPSGDEETVPIDAVVPDGGWRHDDDATLAKLVASMRRFGQMYPLLVRTAPDGRMVLIDGRQKLNALRAIGARTVRVRNVGEMSDADAIEMQLAAELDFETNYAALIQRVAKLLKEGRTPEALAAIAPFDAERIRHFGTLSTLDWSVFDSADERSDVASKAAFRCPCCGHEWSGSRR